jgi:hypothetical protein
LYSLQPAWTDFLTEGRDYKFQAFWRTGKRGAKFKSPFIKQKITVYLNTNTSASNHHIIAPVLLEAAVQELPNIWSNSGSSKGAKMHSDDTPPSVPHFRTSSFPLHIFVHKRRWIQTLPSGVLQITAWTHLTMEKSDKLYGNSILMFGIPL